jgi:hypothetical protein
MLTTISGSTTTRQLPFASIISKALLLVVWRRIGHVMMDGGQAELNADLLVLFSRLFKHAPNAL